MMVMMVKGSLYKNMKKTSVILFMAVVLLPAICSGQEKEVKKVAMDFVKGADDQNPEMLKSVLYPEAKQFVMFGPKILQSSAEEYINQIRDKKLGGNPREVTLDSFLMDGDNTAFVKLIAVGGGLRFVYHLTLFKLENSWKIMTITTKATQAG